MGQVASEFPQFFLFFGDEHPEIIHKYPPILGLGEVTNWASNI